MVIRIIDYNCEKFVKILFYLIFINFLNFIIRFIVFGDDEVDMKIVSSEIIDFMWVGLVSRCFMIFVNFYKFIL